jgi:WD40 repeat protein
MMSCCMLGLQDVKMVCWHPKGEVLVSCSYDDSIKVWIDSDGEWECAQTLAGPGLGHSSTVWGIAFDREGRQMVSCSDDQTLRVWACSFDNPGDSLPLLHLCFHPSSCLFGIV